MGGGFEREKVLDAVVAVEVAVTHWIGGHMMKIFM